MLFYSPQHFWEGGRRRGLRIYQNVLIMVAFFWKGAYFLGFSNETRSLKAFLWKILFPAFGNNNYPSLIIYKKCLIPSKTFFLTKMDLCTNLRKVFSFQLHAFFLSNTFKSNARLRFAKNQANAKQHPEADYLKIILHPHYHQKIIGHILKNQKITNACVFMRFSD